MRVVQQLWFSNYRCYYIELASLTLAELFWGFHLGQQSLAGCPTKGLALVSQLSCKLKVVSSMALGGACQGTLFDANLQLVYSTASKLYMHDASMLCIKAWLHFRDPYTSKSVNTNCLKQAMAMLMYI